MTTSPADKFSFEDVLYKVIQSEIERIVEEEMSALPGIIEKKIRGRVGEIAARVLTHFEMRRVGERVVIEVDFKNLPP